MSHSPPPSANVEEIAKTLEPMIRKIIREELARLAKKDPAIFFLDPSMPLYEDMEDIKRRKERGEISFHSHEEVWNEL
jgi:hypothetical protein